MQNGSALSGNLKFISLGELLQLLGGNGSSGILSLKNHYIPSQAIVFIENGNPVNACCNELSGLEALQALFGWLDGDFEYTPQPLYTERLIRKSRMEIILDALRLLDDGKIPKIGPRGEDGDGQPSNTSPSELPLLKGPLVDYMYVVDEESYAKDDLIVSQGNYGNWIWVILEGQANIVKHTDQGNFPVLRLGEGTFVGSMAAFLMSGSSRSVTVTAASSVQLGVLDTPRLSNEYACMGNDFRRFVLSLDRRLRLSTEISANYFYNNYSICKALEDKRRLDPAEQRLSVLKAGEAVIVRQCDDGPVPCLTLFPGDFLGYVPFLDLGLEAESADVYVSDNVSLSAVNQNQLQSEFARLSPTMRNILAHLANSINVTTFIATRHYNHKN